ncbi:hypothetical protein GGF31_003425 [Allomyces arbusculus]|nr:hypothetical protein GGF31_003425 [Allomyces arbusculus]
MSKTCKHPDCHNIGHYDFPCGKRSGPFCRDHRLFKMVAVKKFDYCSDPECLNLATHGFAKEGIMVFCADHAVDNMKELTRPDCETEGCCSEATFDYPWRTVARRCSKHKLKAMIDVCRPKCIDEGCFVRAMYNFETDAAPVYCRIHKGPNMHKTSKKKCGKQSCRRNSSCRTVHRMIRSRNIGVVV